MKNTYKILWTPQAEEDLEGTINYLEENFSEKEIRRLLNELRKYLDAILENPLTFQLSEFRDVRKVTVLKYNTLYYQVVGENIEILSFFSNRQNPDKRHLISL